MLSQRRSSRARDCATATLLAIAASCALLPVRASADDPPTEFAVVISRTESAYDPAESEGARAINVELAAARLDGSIIAPRRQLSFDRVVGPRTEAAGFAGAQEIVDGRYRDGIGGGICQVATALHIAALEAGLEITRGRPHSITVPYAEPGLDAAVVEGRVDLRIRNPYPFPVRVRVRARDGRLVARIESPRAVPPVEVTSEHIRTLRPRDELVVDERLRPGARRLLREGREGHLYRVRTIQEDRVVNDRVVQYPAQPRTYRVGPGETTAEGG
ncbi:MAG: VanW family protein [Myxococcota bacterium]|nr:VanW family protein [Myxococcota bacterium]